MSEAENNAPPAAPQASPISAGLSPEELKQRQRRNLSIALGLGVFIVLVFAVTILRLGGSAAG